MNIKKILQLKGPLTIWVSTVVVWGLYRNFFLLDEVIEELVLKPMVFIYPVLIYLYYSKSLTTLSLGLAALNKRAIVIWGSIFGLLLALENIFIMLNRGKIIQVDQLVLGILITNFVVSLATAISEEILYRGFLLQKIEQAFQKVLVANIFTALLFTLAHVGIALLIFHYQGVALITYLLTVSVSGFIYGFIFQKTRSVYASIIAHLLWNFTNTFFI